MGASFCRNGRGLPNKRSPVRANALLLHWAALPPRGDLRRPLRVGGSVAASKSVPPYGLRRVLPRAMCRDSSGQVSKALSAGRLLVEAVLLRRRDEDLGSDAPTCHLGLGIDLPEICSQVLQKFDGMAPAYDARMQAPQSLPAPANRMQQTLVPDFLR